MCADAEQRETRGKKKKRAKDHAFIVPEMPVWDMIVKSDLMNLLVNGVQRLKHVPGLVPARRD